MTQLDKVLGYYDATWLDYEVFWSGRHDRAIHFGYYDERTKTHKDAVSRLNAEMAKSVNITKSDTVLDAGCGYGGSAFWIARNIGALVTGITLVPMQAAKGRAYAKKHSLDNLVTIEEMDYGNITLPKNSFTIYWALESLVHGESREQIMKEAFDSLVAGGRVVIGEYTLRNTPPLTEQEHTDIEPWLLGWEMPRLLSPDEYRTILTDAGFVDIKIENITEHIRPSLKRLEIICILLYPFAPTIISLFLKRGRLRHYNGCWSQIHALKRGIWEYSIITARRP